MSIMVCSQELGFKKHRTEVGKYQRQLKSWKVFDAK